jgi:hypothetical protein
MELGYVYCDMYTHYQVTAVQTGGSTTAIAREQLCGHVSPANREHAIMEAKSCSCEKLVAEAVDSSGIQKKGERSPLRTAIK